jgi:hypothetical protein
MKNRRDFIKEVAAAAGAVMLRDSVYAGSSGPKVAIVADPADATVRERPVRWAMEQLRGALSARGLPTEIGEGSAPAGERILVGGRGSKLVRPLLDGTRATLPDAPEALALVRSKDDLAVCGYDARGLVYALLDLADRVAYAGEPAATLRSLDRVAQRPANVIRSITRNFQSEPEDKPWFYDKSFWQRYLTMLAAERFNRFSLAFGLGYNAPRNVRDSYFYFAYPFLLSVPGYAVSARGLPAGERERNLEMLRWISEEATRRGLDFQLALWTHAYQFPDSPNVNYTIDGLTPENHAAYCRDAIHQLLAACPAIAGVTLRAHSESGIPEGSYDFWKQVFEGIARAKRRVEIDIHSKGVEHKLLDMALATGLPVQVSPKYWAEHMGLPYHQASIRDLERNSPTGKIEQQRRFTRYGYADYLAEDRRYGVLFRIWPGTQRLLLWGDPAMAAGYGRYANFCGSAGLELCEPLSFKGRMGSGSPGGHDPYADASLRPAGGDWEKYRYEYRLWGRLLYDPDEKPETWGRLLRQDFGAAAKDCEEALAHASRVLPLVTTAHLPSASNNRYWPEIYTDMPIVDAGRSHPYGDTPSPRRFGTVSSLDPVLFSRIEDFADEAVKGTQSGKYSPLDVARWLEGLAARAEEHLARAEKQAGKPDAAAFRRLAIDARVQSALGRFFAGKLRAGVGYALYQRTADRALLEEALKHYRGARDAWKKLGAETQGAYRSDLTFGMEPWLRGHWKDRLAAIEADLGDMEKARLEKPPAANSNSESHPPLAALLSSGRPPQHARCEHTPPALLRRGEPLAIELGVKPSAQSARVRIHYRHVNQAEDYRVEEMARAGGRYRHVIAGTYTDSRYPLMYFFEIVDGNDAWFYPGLNENLSNQPYLVVRAAKN